MSLQVSLDSLSRDECFFVFLSHNWDRGYDGAKDYQHVVDPLVEPRPHPDTAYHDKMKLVIAALSHMRTSFCPTISDSHIFIWVDYGCIHQDTSACLELKMLDQIIGVCDAMLTVIYDEDLDVTWGDKMRIKGSNDIFAQYGSPKWNKGVYSYLFRAWTRVEMLLCGNIPTIESSSRRKSRFKHAMRTCLEEKRRPHILYGTNEEVRGLLPRILPPLQNSWFRRYNPIHGYLTKESDRNAIVSLVNATDVFQVKEKYEGACDDDGNPHGKGKMTFANGDEYEGYYHHGKQHGPGKFQFSNGNKFTGEYYLHKRHGRGVFTWSNGRIYSGNYLDNKQHGKGVFLFPSGDYYVGQYQSGKRHGKGMYRHKNGDVYVGDFVDGYRDGEGIRRTAEGNVVHNGRWSKNRPIGASKPVPSSAVFSRMDEWNVKSVCLLTFAVIILCYLYSVSHCSHYLLAVLQQVLEQATTWWILTSFIIALMYTT